MDSILKFILFSRKHSETKLNNRYEVTKALGSNGDFDRSYENTKSKIVKRLCIVEANQKQIKATWKQYEKQLCYYPEFYDLASRLLK